VVWKRLKQLVAGRRLDVDDVDAEPELPEPPVDPLTAALARIDRALGDDAVETALLEMRGLLLEVAYDPRVLDRAARALDAAGEGVLAEAFEDAARTGEAAPLIALGHAFVALDDPEIALALARVARERAERPAEAYAVEAEALDALGDHHGVLELAAGLAPDGLPPGLLRRVLLTSATSGAWDTWERFEGALTDDPEDERVRALGARCRAFPERSSDAPERERLFLEHGVVLIDPRPAPREVQAGDVDAGALAGWIAAAAAILRPRLSEELRVAYVSPRSEVIARWLAQRIGCGAIPLSARLPNQELVVALADDDDIPALAEVRAFYGAPSVVFQAAKDPARQGTPMPDIIGGLVSGAALPLASLEGERAADRAPPKLLVAELERAAGRPDEGDAGERLRAAVAWAEARSDHLALAAPAEPEARPLSS